MVGTAHPTLPPVIVDVGHARHLDLGIEVPWVVPDVMGDERPQEPSAVIRARVLNARARQAAQAAQVAAQGFDSKVVA